MYCLQLIKNTVKLTVYLPVANSWVSSYRNVKLSRFKYIYCVCICYVLHMYIPMSNPAMSKNKITNSNFPWVSVINYRRRFILLFCFWCKLTMVTAGIVNMRCTLTDICRLDILQFAKTYSSS